MENDNWISVNDRLPKAKCMKVLWLCKDGVKDVGFWQRGEFWTWDARSNAKITHWQPLTEPSKPLPPIDNELK